MKPPAACGSVASDHRSVRCRACQRIYARRKRRAHHGGIFKRRRYRRKTQATQPPVECTTPAQPMGKALCGSRDIAHRGRRCTQCRAIWNRRHYRKRCARASALGIPLRAQPATAATGVCVLCGATATLTITEDSDLGLFERAACAVDAPAVRRALADEIAAQLRDRTPQSTSGIRLVPRSQYGDARAWLETHYPHALAAVEERARGPEQAERDSALYEIRFASIVAALRAKISTT